MKRILFIFISIVLLASCQESIDVDTANKVVCTWKVTPDVQFEVKSGATTTGVNILWYMVYHQKEDGSFDYIEEMSGFVQVNSTSDIPVPITLIRDQTYKILFVAQHCIQTNLRTDSYIYNVSPSGIMTLNPSAVITSGDQLEAFAKVDEIVAVRGNETKNIVLDRIVAQVNIATTATLPEEVDLTITGAPASYDIFSGTFSGTAEYRFPNLPVPGDDFEVNNITYKRLSTVYIFGGNRVSVTIGNQTITSVDTKQNFKTNIVGNI